MRTASLCALISVILLFSCRKKDEIPPDIRVLPDSVTVHYRGDAYNDPGIYAVDNYSCDLAAITVENNVDTSRYGTYTIEYSVSDEEGNSSADTRPVDIVLPLKDYYDLNYSAVDTCSVSGSFFYTGLIQDCDCTEFGVLVGNISNFGLSASFILPLSGQYNEIISMDTTKATVHFEGSGIMTPHADTIFWQYTISDSVQSDVCSSIWVKQ